MPLEPETSGITHPTGERVEPVLERLPEGLAGRLYTPVRREVREEEQLDRVIMPEGLEGPGNPTLKEAEDRLVPGQGTGGTGPLALTAPVTAVEAGDRARARRESVGPVGFQAEEEEEEEQKTQPRAVREG